MKRWLALCAAALTAGCTLAQPPAAPPAEPGPAAAEPEPAETVATGLCLTSLQMVDERTGWLLGHDQDVRLVLLRTTDGGWTWEDVTPKELTAAQHAHSEFAGLFRDGQSGWLAMTTALDDRGVVSVARTGDGGATWGYSQAAVMKSEAGGVRLASADSKALWLLATSGPLLGSMYKTVFRSADGGAVWSLVSRGYVPGAEQTPDALPALEYVTGIAARSSTEAWVTDVYRGERAIPLYRSTDGGRTWHRQALRYPPGFESADYADAYPPVFFGPSRESGVLLVEFRSDMPAVVAFRTTDGGTTWSPAGSFAGFPADPFIRWFAFPDADHGFAILDETLFATRDGGRSWTSATQPLLKGAELDFVSATVGWAMTNCGRSLYRTGDGGVTWQPVTVNPSLRGEGRP